MFRFATCRKTAATFVLFALALTGSVACAQTKPKVTDAGLAQPKTIMYVGNSFFYSPAGGPHPATVDAATAKFLQEVAWETVQEYYGK